MQEISSSCCADIIEADGAFITGVRGLARRWSCYIGSGLMVMAMKLAMPISLSSILSRLRARRQSIRYAKIILFDLLGRMNNFHSASPESKHEIEIMYFGRASEFLQMTLERMVIPDEGYTLEQLLNRLRKRGDRWAHELDDRHVMCTVNGKDAKLFDTIEVGVEIGIFSRKSIFER